jgi:general secretion pathway protein C
MQPELRNGAVAGYRLSPRGQGHFQAAGLEAGDLVLRVNGASIEGMAPEAIQSAVMSSQSIALDVVRNGAIVRLRLSPESGLSQ